MTLPRFGVILPARRAFLNRRLNRRKLARRRLDADWSLGSGRLRRGFRRTLQQCAALKKHKTEADC